MKNQTKGAYSFCFSGDTSLHIENSNDRDCAFIFLSFSEEEEEQVFMISKEVSQALLDFSGKKIKSLEIRQSDSLCTNPNYDQCKLVVDGSCETDVLINLDMLKLLTQMSFDCRKGNPLA